MVGIIKRSIGNQEYYYMYHDSKKDKRKQREVYLGKKIPRDIEKRKKVFALEMEREYWVPKLEKIHKNFILERKNLPKSIREKNMKNFSVRFTYNTQRIEGSSLTMRDTFLLLEDLITPFNRPNEDVKEAEAHQKLFLHIMKSDSRFTLNTVKMWNKLLLRQTKPDVAGMLRNYDVKISQSKFRPPSYAVINSMMKGFFKWYNLNKKNLNPIELAELVHLKFVTIHPFGDGNGRISRLMMNYVLYKFKYPLFDVNYKERRLYYAALERSQTKDDELPFLRWFMKRYVNMYKAYLK